MSHPCGGLSCKHVVTTLFIIFTTLSINVSCVRLGARPRALTASTPVAKPDYSVYHRKDELLRKVKEVAVANPLTMAIETRTAEDKGYGVEIQVVTVEPAGLSSDHSKKARLLLDFGEHGREYISPELGLQLLKTLGDPEMIKAVVGGGKRGEELLQLMQRVVFKVLPLENVRGRELVEAGKLCERKNGRGVDTNRNWEVDWGKKERDYDPAEEYPGTAPFSEPEVQIVLDVAKGLQPHVWLNVHSGMDAMFTPWDHKAEVPAGALDALRILKTIHADHFTSNCVVGSGGKSVGYLAHGTATDYMFERLKVPMSYTWEIYGDMKADFHDCFRMFNPITRQHVQDVVSLWLKATFRLIELLPTHPATASIFSNMTAAVAAPTQQHDSSTTDSSSATQSAQYAGETQGSSTQHVTVHVTNQEHHASGSQMLINVGLCTAGVAVMAFLVYRWMKTRATPGYAVLSLGSLSQHGLAASKV